MMEFRNHGREQITLLSSCVRSPHVISCFAFHFKEDGAKDNRPSMAFECRDAHTNVFIHEMSLDTLAKALKKAGYMIVPAN